MPRGVLLLSLLVFGAVAVADVRVSQGVAATIEQLLKGSSDTSVRAPELIYGIANLEKRYPKVAAAVTVHWGGAGAGVRGHTSTSMNWNDIKALYKDLMHKKVVAYDFLLDGVRPTHQTVRHSGSKQTLTLVDVWSGEGAAEKSKDHGSVIYARVANGLRDLMRNKGFMAVGHAVVHKRSRVVASWCCVKTRPDIKTLITAWYGPGDEPTVVGVADADRESDPAVAAICGTHHSYAVIQLGEEAPADLSGIKVTCLGSSDNLGTPTPLHVDYFDL